MGYANCKIYSLLSDEELTETPSHSRRPTTRSHRLQLEEQRPSTTPEKKSLSPDIPTMPLDDLDPELAMLAASPVESTSDTGPRKVQIKVQFINLQTTDDPNLRAFLNSISKPVKVIVMDVSWEVQWLEEITFFLTVFLHFRMNLSIWCLHITVNENCLKRMKWS